MRSEPRSARTPVWPLSLSLAATNKIDVSFSSSGYLDVSVHRVPLHTLWIGVWMIRVLRTGFPHSDICGSRIICISPQLFAAYHVFLRLLVPRHPPCALFCLTSSMHSVASFLLNLISCFKELVFFKNTLGLFLGCLDLKIKSFSSIQCMKFSRYISDWFFYQSSEISNLCSKPLIADKTSQFYLFYKSGSHLLSHAVSSIVSSAALVLTIVFGMWTGVSPKRIATRDIEHSLRFFRS